MNIVRRTLTALSVLCLALVAVSSLVYAQGPAEADGHDAGAKAAMTENTDAMASEKGEASTDSMDMDRMDMEHMDMEMDAEGLLTPREMVIDLLGAYPGVTWAEKFVLEVASHTTGVVDYTEKRADYARYGVGEYWRFDPTGGAYHDRSLAGDRLVDGHYERIAIEWRDAKHGRGYSEALGLFVCWEREELRFYDPAQGRYLRTLTEEEAERRAEVAGRLPSEARADAEAEARRRAEARLAELERERREGGGG